MSFPIVAIVLVVVLVAVAVALMALKAKSASQQTTEKPDVYYLKKSLFSPAERSFLGVLESLNYEGVTIASKVRLADVFGIKKGLERGDRQRALNRISAKHVDFLLMHQTDGAPLLGIELDDSSHDEHDRIARDAFVDTVFASAGLPILHVVAKAAYDPKEIHRQIDQSLAGK
ncbi:MAG: DUF2726 domain-containing protein [Opitutaceae bacterium]|nr:DUF2726 domain-containing protein [Opitutaceae bacterium]